MSSSNGLLVVRVEPPPEMDEEFNDWYDTEHIPERLAVPGFLTARRFRLNDHPSYLALYDVESPEVLDSPAYRVFFEGKNRTPWTHRVGSRLKVARKRYVQLDPGNESLSSSASFVALLPLSHRKAAEDLLAHARSKSGVKARLFEVGAEPKTPFERNITARLSGRLRNPLRLDERFPFRSEVEVRCASWPEARKLLSSDLSRGGLFVGSTYSAEKGESVSITISGLTVTGISTLR